MKDVSVIIPYHDSKNQKFLDLCLSSLVKSEHVDMEIIVVSCAEVDPEVPDGVWVKRDPHAKHFSQKINSGVASSRPSKFILVGNDDTIYHPLALRRMIDAMGDYKYIMNPMSNCDNGYFYSHRDLRAGDLKLKLQMDLEETEYHVEAIRTLEPGAPILVMVPGVCFYCTMIPRHLFEALNGLDETYQTGHEDSDFCIRARQMGYVTTAYLWAWVFHYSGASSKHLVKSPQRMEQLKHNQEYFNKKFGVKDGV